MDFTQERALLWIEVIFWKTTWDGNLEEWDSMGTLKWHSSDLCIKASSRVDNSNGQRAPVVLSTIWNLGQSWISAEIYSRWEALSFHTAMFISPLNRCCISALSIWLRIPDNWDSQTPPAVERALHWESGEMVQPSGLLLYLLASDFWPTKWR